MTAPPSSRSGLEDPYNPEPDYSDEEDEVEAQPPRPPRRTPRLSPSLLVEQPQDLPQQPGADLWGSVPAPLAYSAAAAALMVPEHASWWQRLTGTGTKARARTVLQRQLEQQLVDQARATVGQAVSPVVVINQPPAALAGQRVGLSRSRWLFLVCCCTAVVLPPLGFGPPETFPGPQEVFLYISTISWIIVQHFLRDKIHNSESRAQLGYYGLRATWRETVLPLLRRLLVQLAGLEGGAAVLD
jgi:hypothetical protein